MMKDEQISTRRRKFVICVGDVKAGVNITLSPGVTLSREPPTDFDETIIYE
jgi:hypothetical protein